MRRLLLAAALLALSVSAHANETIRFMLNWKPEGTNAPFFYAVDHGFFARRGLDVVLDPGSGSSAPITRIASGAYQAGFGDINTMIRFDADKSHPQETAVLMIYNRSPLVIISLAGSGIQKPKDLEGHRLGAPIDDAAWQMFPAFAALTGIDIDRVQIKNVAPNLRDALLARHEIDAGTGYDATSLFALKGIGMSERNVHFMYYADYGIDLYSNGIVVSNSFLQNTKALQALADGCLEGWMTALHDPAEVVESLAKEDPLIDRRLELEKLKWVIAREIVTPESRRLGFGALDPQRLTHTIGLLQGVYKLPSTPTESEVWTDRFLPPISQREVR
jgi:NitT/TauT family transport system substrate-binding protein